ncbi:hypothetical protein FHU30_001423 [Actinomadura rupiterrae]|nr:hypothetical protein [Actinomadura rupiterrae]
MRHTAEKRFLSHWNPFHLKMGDLRCPNTSGTAPSFSAAEWRAC